MSFTDGDVVTINYVGRVKQSGEIIDLTDKDTAESEDMNTEEMELEPVSIMLGEGYVIDGLDDAIKKMEEGEEQSVTIPKEKAFGSRSSDRIKTVPKREFDDHDIKPRRGMPVEIDGKRGTVLTASSGRVKVDFNHPLAGRDLEYTVEVVDTIDSLTEKIDAILSFHIKPTFDAEIEDDNVTVIVDEEIPEKMKDHLSDELTKLDGVKSVTVQSSENQDEE